MTVPIIEHLPFFSKTAVETYLVKELLGYIVLFARFYVLLLIHSEDKLRSINLLTPNDDYSGRTAPLTSKHCILYIYSTNICTEHFNPLKPNDDYSGRTAQLTSKHCILYIYSTHKY